MTWPLLRTTLTVKPHTGVVPGQHQLLRAFARLRAMDVDVRACMTLPHTERELTLRVNKPVVEAVLRLALADLDRM